MICPKCARLNPDENEKCMFCSADLYIDGEKAEFEPVREPLPEIDVKGLDKKGPKYFRYGWLLILCAAAVFVLIIFGIVSGVSPEKKTVKKYVESVCCGELEDAMETSAVDLQKYYTENAQSSSIFDIFGLFGGQQQTYEDFLSSYAETFNQIKASSGDSKYSVKVKDDSLLDDNASFSLMQSFAAENGNILKSTQIEKVKAVSAVVKTEGRNSFVTFYTVKIDSDWYVLTDATLLSPYNP